MCHPCARILQASRPPSASFSSLCVVLLFIQASIHGANGRHINFIHLAPTGAIQSSIQASRQQAPCQFHSSFAAPDGPHQFNSSSRQQAPHQFNPILLRCADGRHFIQASRRRAIIIHRCADWCHFHRASRRRAPIHIFIIAPLHIFSLAPAGANPNHQLRAAGRSSISSPSRRPAPIHIFSFGPAGAYPYHQLRAAGRSFISSGAHQALRLCAHLIFFAMHK